MIWCRKGKNVDSFGRVTHICVNKLTIIGSDNGLQPGRRQAIIWINTRILLIWRLGTHFNFNRNSNIFIEENTFEIVVCEMLPIRLDFNVLSEPMKIKLYWAI